jgi:formylglycine-generating enzyme required for sulfatase activity
VAEETRWRPPSAFDDYRLVRRLGEGTMGEVWLAHDLVLDRPVAVKFIRALDPEAHGRFLVEARAAARIQHPNVMALYRVGELDGHPFLISEYVRGRSLSDLPLPLPGRRARELAIGLARGLAAAHRQGVLHRDIKLANAIVGDDDVVKLLDFSLAKLLDGSSTREPPAPASDLGALALDRTLAGSPPGPDVTSVGTLVGTPNYMAPELWRAEPATRSSDVYALGVALYMLCCGRPPTDAASVAELVERVQLADPPPLQERAPEVDPAFAAIVDRCVRREPGARFTSGEELRAALEGLAPVDREGRGEVANPYRGLRAFEAEHRGLFFGRTREIAAVLDRLRGQSFALVVGDSGVGKSSLCRAGVLPLVDAGALDAGRRWRSAVVTPGRQPVRALVAGLARALGLLLPAIDELLADGDVLERTIRRKLGADRGCAVFVDQLEELVTLAEPTDAERTVRLLVRLADVGVGLRVLATARGDFLTRLAALPGLGDELPRALYFLRPLAADGVRQAVVGPAEAQGVAFESEALVERLVAAGVAGSLPLLQFALAELWEVRDQGHRTITAAALDRIGGVSGALARHADAALARMDAATRLAARDLLLRLVTVDDTRASLGPDELGPDGAQRGALEALIAARLLVAREVPGGTAYEIAHEALIGGWLTLQIWLDEAREARVARHRLSVAAADWDRLGRPADALWRERQLAEAAALDAGALRPHELEFLAASRARVRRRRLLRRLTALAVPAVAVVVGLGVQLARRADLDRRIEDHRTTAAGAVVRAREADAAVVGGRVAAFAAFAAGDREVGEARWKSARTEVPAVVRAYDEAARALEGALNLDATHPGVRRDLADVLLAQAQVAEREHRPEDVAALLGRAALYDDGGAGLARWNAPGSLAIASDPRGARVTLQVYVDDVRGRRELGEARALGVTPLAAQALPAGSYLLTFAADGHVEARLPLVLRRGERVSVAPRLLPVDRVPDGFVHVPGGRFLFGAATDEGLRRDFLGAPPMHELTTDAYLIARHETTYAEWIAFLEALPPAERAERMPGGESGGYQQSATLSQPVPGVWELRMPRGEATYTARSGEPLVYRRRTRRAVQDWSRMPVTGIDWADASAYLEWLDRTGRVAGARFCSEIEWERAARGADGRPFPTGEEIGPEDANYDATYAHDYAAMGPDAVGSYPASVSPFGLHDVMGNVFEWTRSAFTDDEKIARGGGFFFGALTGSTMNRTAFSADFRDGSLGLRVCATPAAPR